VVNVEKHLFDQSVSITSANAGFINCLSFIAAGDDYNNRQGNTCKMNYITIPAGRVIQNGGDSNQVRMLIFMDTANQGTTPAVTDVLAMQILMTLLIQTMLKDFGYYTIDYLYYLLIHQQDKLNVLNGIKYI